MKEKVFNIGDKVRVTAIGMYCENYTGEVRAFGANDGKSFYGVMFDHPTYEDAVSKFIGYDELYWDQLEESINAIGGEG